MFCRHMRTVNVAIVDAVASVLPKALCCAVLCCAVLCCAVLCCAALCCAVVTLTHQQRHAEHCTNYLTEQKRCSDACGQRAATVSVVAVRKVSRAAPFTGAGRSPDQLEAPPQFMS